MERHIDLDAAMIKHLEAQGYIVAKHEEDIKAQTDLPTLLQKALERARVADKKYDNAWDYLTPIGLAEIIMMKAARTRSAVEHDDFDTAEDSLVDLVNYAAKLYLELIAGED